MNSLESDTYTSIGSVHEKNPIHSRNQPSDSVATQLIMLITSTALTRVELKRLIWSAYFVALWYGLS